MDNLSLIGTSQAAKHLGVSMSWLRSKKSACVFVAGEHWIYATGSPGGRVLWNVNAICHWQVEQTKLHAEIQHQLAADIEIYVEINNA